MTDGSVTRSQGLLLAAHVVRLGLFIGVTSLLGRKLAPTDFAFVYLLASVYLVAMEVLDMGTTAIATRNIAADPARERLTLQALIALRRLIAIAMLVAVLAWAWLAEETLPNQRLLIASAAFGIFLMYLYAYQPVFQVRQAYGAVLAIGLVGHSIFLVACLVALQAQAGGVVIGFLIVAREVFQVLGCRWVAVRMLGYRLRVRWWPPGVMALLGPGWIVGLAAIGYKGALYAGIFILNGSGSPDDAGSFSAAHRLLVPLADVAWILVVPLFASMSVALSRDEAAFRLQIEAYGRLLLGLALLAGVSGFWLAPALIEMFYGDSRVAGLESTLDAFRWLSIGGVFAFATPIFVVSETVQGRATALLAIASLGLMFSLSANAWAATRHGAQGVAVVQCLLQGLLWLALVLRALARREIRPVGAWLGYALPALLLAILLDRAATTVAPGWQLTLACIWVAGSLLVMLNLPLQRGCRAILSTLPAHAPPKPGARFPAVPRGNV